MDLSLSMLSSIVVNTKRSKNKKSYARCLFFSFNTERHDAVEEHTPGDFPRTSVHTGLYGTW